MSDKQVKKWVDIVSEGRDPDGSKQKLIEEIEVILAKAASGMATREDLEKARTLNKQLGGEFASQIAEMERIVEKAEELRRESSVSSVASIIDPVTSADSYFAREEVIIARKAIADMEDGKEIDDDACVQVVKYLVSDDEVKMREAAILELEKEIEAIIKVAIIRGNKELSKNDASRLKKVYAQQNDLIQDSHKGKFAQEIIGVEFSKGLTAIASISEATPEVQKALPAKKKELEKGLTENKQQSVDASRNMTSLAKAELEEIQQMLTIVNDEPANKQQEGAQKLSAIDRKKIIEEAAAKRKEKFGVRRSVGEIHLAKEKKKEMDVELSAVEDKTVLSENKVEKQKSTANKLAAKRAKKANLPRSINCASVIEVKGVIKPDSSPSAAKNTVSLKGIS